MKSVRVRAMGRVVEDYLTALDGPRRDQSHITRLHKKLARLEALPNPTDKMGLLLHLSALDATRQLIVEVESRTDIAELEAMFVKVAAEWAEVRGVTHSAFVALGVPLGVLKQAGIR